MLKCLPRYRLYNNCITVVLLCTVYNMYWRTTGHSVRIWVDTECIPLQWQPCPRGARIAIHPRQLIFFCFYLRPTPHFPLYLSVIHTLYPTLCCRNIAVGFERPRTIKCIIVKPSIKIVQLIIYHRSNCYS